MQTVYKLNADELNNEFLESIKTLFPHKTIEVVIHEIDDVDQSPPHTCCGKTIDRNQYETNRRG